MHFISMEIRGTDSRSSVEAGGLFSKMTYFHGQKTLIPNNLVPRVSHLTTPWSEFCSCVHTLMIFGEEKNLYITLFLHLTLKV